jgi:hypothetical protein
MPSVDVGAPRNNGDHPGKSNARTSVASNGRTNPDTWHGTLPRTCHNFFVRALGHQRSRPSRSGIPPCSPGCGLGSKPSSGIPPCSPALGVGSKPSPAAPGSGLSSQKPSAAAPGSGLDSKTPSHAAPGSGLGSKPNLAAGGSTQKPQPWRWRERRRRPRDSCFYTLRCSGAEALKVHSILLLYIAQSKW